MSASSDDYHDALKYIKQLKKALSEILEDPKLHCDAIGCTYCGARIIELHDGISVIGYQIRHEKDCVVIKWRKLLE